MQRVMSFCFWLCVATAAIGAGLAIALVWGWATDYEISEARQTVTILFIASGLTLIAGRLTGTKRLSEPQAVIPAEER
jgi:hypothetical protein